MTNQEAMKIMCDAAQYSHKETVRGFHAGTGTYIILGMYDILANLEMNDYELDLDFIQDLCGEDGNMFQGHSLSEIEICSEG